MSERMQPSIGRIVLFRIDRELAEAWNWPADGFATVREGDVLPAIIVHCWNSDIVNLRVFRDALSDGYVTSVPYADGDGPDHRSRTWHWPGRG